MIWLFLGLILFIFCEKTAPRVIKMLQNKQKNEDFAFLRRFFLENRHILLKNLFPTLKIECYMTFDAEYGRYVVTFLSEDGFHVNGGLDPSFSIWDENKQEMENFYELNVQNFQRMSLEKCLNS